jgi:hypothetical protein
MWLCRLFALPVSCLARGLLAGHSPCCSAFPNVAECRLWLWHIETPHQHVDIEAVGGAHLSLHTPCTEDDGVHAL